MPTAYPLAWPEGWPRARQRKRAHFGTTKLERSSYSENSWRVKSNLTISDAIKRVLSELGAFGVPNGEAVISTNLAVRLDGLPRTDQKAPDDPGAAVYWRRPGEATKVMAIDIYDRVADNLGAVAATLNAMRAIERHGGAQILERAFTGFTALPAPKSWREILGLNGAPVTEEAITTAFRAKARSAHPDAGGSHAAMAELNAARDAALREIGT